MKQGHELNALFYPFSRTTEISSLKQFMLLYDKTTFLDPVSDEDWRAHLFANLENVHGGFEGYTDLQRNFPFLIEEGVVQIIDPETIEARNSALTTASIVSDLADENWLRLCNPKASGIPFEVGETGAPLWQMFKSKIPVNLLNVASENSQIGQHIYCSGGDHYAWHLSYSAGSAIALNVHMAAAEELGLQLVSDSPLHNNLLLAKAERCHGSKNWTGQRQQQVSQVANGVMLTVLDRLLPSETLDLVTVEEILKFRERTADLRREFASEIRNLVVNHHELSAGNHTEIPDDLARRLAKDIREYGNELGAVRDTLWPRLIGSVAAVGPASASGFGVVASYIFGSGYVMAGSLMVHALSPLKTVLEYRADRKKIQRSSSSAVAFLVAAKSLSKH